MKNGGVWEVDLTAGQSTYKFYSPNTRYLNGIAPLDHLPRGYGGFDGYGGFEVT